MKFIHAADIHLDTPLQGLVHYAGVPVNEIRNATRRAFEKLLDAALAHQVDFVIIAGDLYDVGLKSFESALFFNRQMTRLKEAGIDVYLIHGNHDAASKLIKQLRPPANVHVFRSNEPQTFRRDVLHLPVAIHGQSFATPEVTDDLAANYPPPIANAFNIGVLHTNLSGISEHANYAPCSLDTLRNKGYQYWALGHVHNRQIFCSDPYIVFPGNIQGRHGKEPGEKSCELVTVSDASAVSIETIPTSVLLWSEVEIDASDCQTVDDLYDKLPALFGKLVSGSHERVTALRVGIAGSSEADLLREQLTKLHRIAGNKPDVARLQKLRTALAVLEWVPALPANARRQRDQAVADLTDATAQIESLTNQIAQRAEKIKALPMSDAFKAHAQEIEALNAGTHDYLRGILDLPKRCDDRNKVIQRAEMEWRTIWHQRPVSDAEQLRSAYARKTEVHALITQHARLTVSLEQAEDSLRSDRNEYERLSRELAASDEPRDPATLLASIEQSKRLGDTGEAISRLQAECQRIAAEIARDLRSLPLWSGTDEELESLHVPMLSTVEQYARDWEELAGHCRDLSSRESSLAISIREKQAEVERLGLQVSTAGEKELAEARARRNHVWDLIRAFAFEKILTSEAAQNQSGSYDPLPEVFAQQLRRSDDIADMRFSSAKDVAIHDRLVKEISSVKNEQQSVEAELTSTETNFNDLRGRWRSEWSWLAVDPLSPAEIKEWISRRQTILDKLEHRRSKEKDLQLIGERAALAAAEIRVRLCELGCDAVKETDSLSIVQNVAEALAREVQERRQTVRDLRRNLHLIDLDKQEAEVAESKAKLSEWAQKWSPLMSGLLLPPTATPEQASAALDVLEKVFLQLEKGNDLQHRIDRIRENIAQFEADAAKLADSIDSSLTSLKPQEIAASLQERLLETEKAETRRIELETQNTSAEAAIASCRAKAQVATATLQRLMELASCQHDQQLETAIAAAEEKAEKQEHYNRITAGLVERNAIPDLKHIEEEASAYELDSLHNEVARHEERQKELQEQVFKSGAEYGRLQQEYERLEGSEDAALQAQTAEDALAKARPAIAQYLRLRIAAGVLQSAMDSYREKHQGPVLTQASELFSRLTLGEHDGLTTAFGDDDKPVLVAIRKNKEQVEVAGLSDGTRDQLYLALRLAAIEDHVTRVAPCPVILDDILIHSDDLRASAALEVLAIIAQRTQVLFFTHHSRLADLGLKAGASVVQLQSSAASALA